ncbi:MAG TPA: HAD hydrolase-like protein [Bacteroidales bacterium]|nr:HAD hydrolase-like protein [Bacteroidales bacterium]
MTNIQNLLFDLDGTLTDPREGIINSILYALDHLGIEESRVNELNSLIGPPLRESFIKRYNLSEKMGDRALKLYREYFGVKGIYENRLYEGVDNVLESLYETKFRIFLATSKPTVYATEILKHFNLDRFFTDITGSNIDNTRTDKSEVIAHVVNSNTLITKHSVMIGDRKHDLIGARNNNMRSVAVTYGYGTTGELRAEHPDLLVNSCRELIPAFIKS